MAIDLDGSTRGRRGMFEAPWPRALIRTILAVLALWTLYLANRRYYSVDEGFRPGMRLIIDSSAWLSFVGIEVLSGLLFGLAVCMPFTRVRYAWDRLLVAAVAFAPVAHYWLVFAWLVPRTRDLSRWWVRDWFWSPQAQLVSAVLVGVALASGLRPATEDGRSVDRASNERKVDPPG